MNLLIIKSFAPEIFFSICILTQLLFNVTTVKNLKLNYPILEKEASNQTLLILLCVFLLLLNCRIEGSFSNLLLINNYSCIIIKWFVVLFSILSLGAITAGASIQNLNFFEFFNLFLLSTLSALLLISSNDFILCYLSLELQVLCYYILSTFKRGSAFSSESGLKYFVFGSFFSCILLFGCSSVYISLGTLNLTQINLILSFSLIGKFFFLKFCLSFGILLLIITLLFKISAAPFHFWSPDVYDGSPIGSTVVFGVVSKIAVLHILVKILFCSAQVFLDLQYFFLTIGILSVFVGAFFAIRQKRFKRLIVYSSVAQTGFIIATLSSGTINSVVSAYFFLSIYVITSLLIWNSLVQFSYSNNLCNIFKKKVCGPIFLSNLSDYLKINKTSSILFSCIFFSLAGVPPFCGFLSEVFVFYNLIKSGFFTAVLILLLLSGVSAFYYIRITKIVFFEKKKSTHYSFYQTIFKNSFFENHFCISVVSIFSLLFFFFFPEFIILNCYCIIL